MTTFDLAIAGFVALSIGFRWGRMYGADAGWAIAGIAILAVLAIDTLAHAIKDASQS